MGEEQWYVRLCITSTREVSCPPLPPRAQSTPSASTTEFIPPKDLLDFRSPWS